MSVLKISDWNTFCQISSYKYEYDGKLLLILYGKHKLNLVICLALFSVLHFDYLVFCFITCHNYICKYYETLLS